MNFLNSFLKKRADYSLFERIIPVNLVVAQFFSKRNKRNSGERHTKLVRGKVIHIALSQPLTREKRRTLPLRYDTYYYPVYRNVKGREGSRLLSTYLS